MTPQEIRFYRATGDFGFLSNLYPAPITIEDNPWSGRTFPDSERAYQFMKPKDIRVAEWLVNAPYSDVCATSAHALLTFRVRPNWNQIKVGVMRKVLWEKFKQHKELYNKLQETKGLGLIEASNGDHFWGIGKNGLGKNMLGELLMELRDSPTEFLTTEILRIETR